MKNDTTNHYAIRFRNGDGLHKKGDIQFFGNGVTYIGQTPECGLQLPPHPQFADSCYAVIKTDAENGKRYLIRQEQKADICINGSPLAIAAELSDNDRITFDNTTVTYTVEKGEQPQVTYIKHKSQKALWCAIALIAAALAAIILQPKEQERSVFERYVQEIESIYKIEADTFIVTRDGKDTLAIIPLPRAEVGSGFVTQCGHFVTARHCIEFWLGYENELKPDFNSIESPVVKWAIEAEADSTLHLTATLKITDSKESVYRYTSDDFIMDKSRDNIYECGDFNNEYLWRSIISRYEDADAELGDAAIMEWEHSKGNIKLAEPDLILNVQRDITLQSFGYPQQQSKQKAMLTADNGCMYFAPESADDILYCRSAFDKGFSGAPVFIDHKERKSAIGIVSRLESDYTVIVPVSQIHNLINSTRQDGEQE